MTILDPISGNQVTIGPLGRPQCPDTRQPPATERTQQIRASGTAGVEGGPPSRALPNQRSSRERIKA